MPALPISELGEALRWYLLLFLAGVAVQPVAQRLIGETGALSYALGRVLGFLLAPFIAWYGAAIGLVSFSGTGPLVAALGLGAVFLLCRSGGPPKLPDGAVSAELTLLVLFVLGLAARLVIADLNSLEKYMDHGFLAASMRADAMPPEDMWFAGEGINYYYIGHAAAAFWAVAADVSSDHAYQLMMASLFALSGLLTVTLATTLAAAAGPATSAVLGWSAAALVLYGGNLHSVLYTDFRELMGATNPEFYYPDSTRFIGFDPPTEDKGFTEFLAYGFKVGDMHAHVLATPAFLAGLLLLFAIFRRNWPGVRLDVAQSAALGWLTGLLYITNAWDAAILGVFAALLGVALLAWSARLTWGLADEIAVHILVTGFLAFATAAPFLAAFEVFADGPRLAESRTPLWQLAVVYGHLVPVFLAGLAAFLLLRPRDGATVFAGLLALGTVGLVLLPELVFVKDIYGTDHARANTMFKFSFRAQSVGFIAGFGLAGMLLAQSRLWRFVAILALLPLVAPIRYAEHTFAPPSKIQSLSGMSFLGPEQEVVRYLRGVELAPGESIAEAPGKSFTEENWVSAMTGLPVPAGWFGHEWLWRDDIKAIDTRGRHIRTLYQTDTTATACRILRRYGIRFVVIGKVERAAFEDLGTAITDILTEPVLVTDETEVRVPRPGACDP